MEHLPEARRNHAPTYSITPDVYPPHPNTDDDKLKVVELSARG